MKPLQINSRYGKYALKRRKQLRGWIREGCRERAAVIDRQEEDKWKDMRKMFRFTLTFGTSSGDFISSPKE
jgi:hypothetical protein